MKGRGSRFERHEDLSASPRAGTVNERSAAQDGIDGQRRQVTVLFADMAGYTPFAERVGEENTYLLIRRVIKEMSEAVHIHGGTVQELTGDGLMALFGAPVAIEDAPVQACRAALEIQNRMATVGEETAGNYGILPKFRVAVHTGPLVIGKVGDNLRVERTALGDTVNLASRLEGEAEPGSIIISEVTNQLVEGFAITSFVGERVIKGKTGRQRVFRLEGIRSEVTRFDVAVGRGLTPLVGRRDELATIRRCLEEAQAGALRIVSVVGDAGIGKSRLLHEMRQQLGDAVFAVQGHCVPTAQATPFYLFIELVKASFGIVDRDAPQEVRRKLQQGLEALALATDDVLPYLLNLLGYENSAVERLASEVVGIRTRHALSAFLRARCRLSTVAMFIEDVHWIDTASEDWMTRIADNDRNLPLLIACAYRPHYRPPWTQKPGTTLLSLGRLSDDNTVELLKRRLDAEELPIELVRLVVEKTEGNPLFAEEVINYMLGRRRIQLTGARVSYDIGDSKEGLPQTLENLLLERFDRLEPGARAILEAASVIGPRFSADLVGAVARVNGSTASHLLDLEHQELIFRRPEANEYRFKHALVQDAIYNSLLTPSRVALHERVANAIEQSRGGNLSEFVDVLADHYNQTTRAEKTVHYMALAGAKSLQVYSLGEADARFRRVIELIKGVPDCADDAFLADVLLKMARLYYYRAEFNSIIGLLEPYLPRMEALGDKRRLSRFLFEVGYAYVFSANGPRGKRYLERALELGNELADDESIGYATLGLMFYTLFWAEPSDAKRRTFIELGNRVTSIANRLNDVWLAAKCRNAQWGEAVFYSRFEEASDYCVQLFELSKVKNDPRPMGFGLWQMAVVNLHRDEFEKAIEHADKCLGMALSPLDQLAARAAKGGGYALTGRAKEGSEALRAVRSECERLGFVGLIMVIDVYCGASMCLAGNFGAGVKWIKDSIKRSEAWGNHNIPALGHLVLGEIYLQMAMGEEKPPLSVVLKNLGFVLTNIPLAAAKSRRHFKEAIRMSRQVDMPGHLARSLLGLGQLHKIKRRPAQARACLEEAHEIAGRIRAHNVSAKVEAALDSL